MRLDNCENTEKPKGIRASAVRSGILLYPPTNFARHAGMLTLSYANILMNLLHVALGEVEKLFCRVKKAHVTSRDGFLLFCVCRFRAVMSRIVNYKKG
jgi:hypothetical protein